MVSVTKCASNSYITPQMLLSVIIPTCNRNDLLFSCLSRLSPQVQTTNVPFEVIVSDDGKNNPAKDLVSKHFRWAKWIEGPKKGPASNRNFGAAHATGDWLVFIDDDCLPDTHLIQEYVAAITTKPDLLAYEGRIYVDEPQTSFLQEAPLNNTGGFFWSCNICVSKKLFTSLGGFDENFPFAAMEDVDFFARLKKVTDKHAFLYSAAVLHPWRLNPKLFSTILKRYKAQLYFISKHPAEKNKMNYQFYFRSFLIFFSDTLKNAWKYRFAGARKKISCDLLQIYFGVRALFKLDKEYR